MDLLSFLPHPGLAVGVFVLTAAALCIKHPGDRQYEKLFLTAVGFAGLVVVIGLLIPPLMSTISPMRLDEYLLVTEGWFGYPSFRIGVFLEHHTVLRTVAATVYSSYTAPLVLLPILYFNRDALKFMRTMIFNFVPCFPFYMICPVSGPQYAFKGFPDQIPIITHPKAIHILAVPNGMPSVHMSTALLVLFFLRPWRIGKIFGWFWVIFTIISTLGFGEHYVLDLVAALPYTALILYCGGFRYRWPIAWRGFKTRVIEPAN